MIQCMNPAAFHNKPKVSWLRSRLGHAVLGLALVVGAAPLAHAEDAPDAYDARVGGYPGKMYIEKGGVGMTWILYILLAAIGCGVMFKNPNRSHLD